MIPVTITLREGNSKSAGHFPESEEALLALANEIRGLDLHVTVRKGKDWKGSDLGSEAQIEVTPEILDSRYISEFIATIGSFIHRFPKLHLELEFDGNKLSIDELSISRAERDIQRLTAHSFSIGGANTVIGSSNTISPITGWPRKKD